MRIYVKTIRAKFDPDTFRNDGAFGFLEEVASTRTTVTRS